VVTRTVLADGTVAGTIGSWPDQGQQMIGYWIGREYWGRGVATQALALLISDVLTRPLYAHVATHNAGSIRVLQNAASNAIVPKKLRRPNLTTESRSSSSGLPGNASPRGSLPVDDTTASRAGNAVDGGKEHRTHSNVPPTPTRQIRMVEQLKLDHST
jgi:hypothetical protein